MRPSGTNKLRDVIDRDILVHLASTIEMITERFDSDTFVRSASRQIETMSFFGRITHAASCLGAALPADFEHSCDILLNACPPPNDAEGYGVKNFHVLILCRYVSLYGLPYPKISLVALARFTESYTAEFDIRPFIQERPKETFEFLTRLASSRSFHHRRLASEGCRPRLPMASHLKQLKSDPTPCIDLLQLLRADPVKYVQKSVANHVADILKDNPSIGYALLRKWRQDNDPITNWIIRNSIKAQLTRGDKQAIEIAIDFEDVI